jgi:hypothetical protein
MMAVLKILADIDSSPWTHGIRSMPEAARPCAPFLAAPCPLFYVFVRCPSTAPQRARPRILRLLNWNAH